ncbi:Protein kinase-like domain [Cordyceps militaris CM01]|uniref:non-specific serine/threonine protein kinase n=1 Tax=Cordyceps militaris (strain CM01) TaxID=983644 RepID=G3JC00_CORMM|nr:Protein kinase-like domain [Cordyceps militaris CM01]EGX93718.1 Protein kinase-like domain [Cordyceps militaris CM01]
MPLRLQMTKMVSSILNKPCSWFLPLEAQDAVLDVYAEPGDCLYRIRRGVGHHARVVYVEVFSTEFIPEDERTDGYFILKRLACLDEWRHQWKTLVVATTESGLRVKADAFQPHCVSPDYVYDDYPKFDILKLKCDHNLKVRTWRCEHRGSVTYVKLARFDFEVAALEQEIKTYHLLRGSSLAPAMIGYVYEDTCDRVVGFITEQAVGPYPEVADHAACAAALHELHEKGIAHGDLNKYNIIMTSNGPKFIDFEASNVRGEAADWEQLAQKETQEFYGRLSDESGLGAPWRLVQRDNDE